jgi:hypothetical protein
MTHPRIPRWCPKADHELRRLLLLLTVLFWVGVLWWLV